MANCNSDLVIHPLSYRIFCHTHVGGSYTQVLNIWTVPFFPLNQVLKRKKEKARILLFSFFLPRSFTHFQILKLQSSFFSVILRHILNHTLETRHFSNINLFLTSTRTNKRINANSLVTSSKKTADFFSCWYDRNCKYNMESLKNMVLLPVLK